MSKEKRNSYNILAKGQTIPIGSTSLEKYVLILIVGGHP